MIVSFIACPSLYCSLYPYSCSLFTHVQLCYLQLQFGLRFYYHIIIYIYAACILSCIQSILLVRENNLQDSQCKLLSHFPWYFSLYFSFFFSFHLSPTFLPWTLQFIFEFLHIHDPLFLSMITTNFLSFSARPFKGQNVCIRLS